MFRSLPRIGELSSNRAKRITVNAKFGTPAGHEAWRTAWR